MLLASALGCRARAKSRVAFPVFPLLLPTKKKVKIGDQFEVYSRISVDWSIVIFLTIIRSRFLFTIIRLVDFCLTPA